MINSSPGINVTNPSFKESVTIEGTEYDITQIGQLDRSSGFNGQENMKGHLTLPASLQALGMSAFKKCTGLTSISLPSSLTTIGDSAFNGCTGLTSISLPSSLTTIGDSAFNGCPIKQVNFEGNDTYKWANNVGQGHLLSTSDEWDYQTSPVGCLAYGDIDMSKATDLSEIKANLFSNCAGVTFVNLPNSITRISDTAFLYCSGLSSIDLSKCTSLTIIGQSAFYLCGLTSISLPSSLETIGNYAFYSCPIKQVNFEGNDTYKWANNVGQGHLLSTSDEWNYQTPPIGNIAYGDIDMSKATNLSEIKALLFYNCAGITSINLPNSITAIKSNAFYDCSELASISLPSSLTAIAASSFQNDSKISEVFLNFNDTQIKSLGSSFKNQWLSNAVGSDKMSNVNVYFPRNEADAYLNVDNQKTLGIYGCKIGNNTNATSWIGGNVTSGNLFYTIENSNISPISIDNLIAADPVINSKIVVESKEYSINEIKSTYFQSNINLFGTLTIDSGITTIDADAFNECENISKIYLNWTVEQLKKSFDSNDDKLIIDPNWLGSLKDKQDLKIYVPKGTKTTYEKYKDQLGITNNEIIESNNNNSNLPLILGLSLGLGIPALAGAITGAIIGIEKHKDKKLNKKKSKK